MATLRDKIKGELVKKKTSPIFVLGSKTNSEEDDIIQSEEWIKNGLCPRCGGKFEKRADGQLVCKHDGLILSKGLKRKYGLK